MSGLSIPPFAALRAFEAFGRLGGVRKAASALSLHHAVISRHLAALESWIGVSLIHRERSGGELTNAGRRYHARVSAAICELAEATVELSPALGDPRIRIWSNGGFSARWLSSQLIAFSALNPGIDIELRPSDTQPDLLHHEADVDIRYFGDAYSPPPGGKGLQFLEFARPPVMALAGGALVADLMKASAAKDLLSAPLLHEESDDQWRAWFVAQGVELTERLPGPRLWHAHLAIDAAVQGQGLALASSFLAGDHIAAGRLVEIAPAGVTPKPLGGYVFTAREDRWMSAPLARLRRWLQEAAARQG